MTNPEEHYYSPNFLVDATEEMKARGEKILETAEGILRILAEGHEESLAKWLQGKIDEAVTDEREACALIADAKVELLTQILGTLSPSLQHPRDIADARRTEAWSIAKAIRARGKKE